jgi:periplasmic protein TonB
MPRAMFRDVLEPRTRVRSRARYTVPLSILAHVLLCAAIVAVPLTATDVLPTPQAMIAFAIPAASPPPPPPPPPRARAPEPARTPQPASSPDAAPLTAPDEIRPEAPSRERAALLPGVPGGVEAGVPDGQIGGIAIDMPSAPPPATPPQQPLHVGGRIKAPQKVRHVSPVYPPIALSARVQGSVIIDATIGPDGRVTDARVRRGVPLLDQSALDAVRQWEFTPTLLNGVAVPVIMTVTVTFTLQ